MECSNWWAVESSFTWSEAARICLPSAASISTSPSGVLQAPSVMIDGILEIKNPTPDGIDHIKEALVGGVDSDEAEISISYVGAPKYRITVTAGDYKTAEQELKSAVNSITGSVQKSGGSVSFKRKEEK